MSVSVGERQKTWAPANYVCARECICKEMCVNFFDVAVCKHLRACARVYVRASDCVCETETR